MKKCKHIILGGVLAACMAISLTPGALAVDYRFDGASSKELYPSTEYATVYGAEYVYGGQNVVDFSDIACPYGFSDGTSTGAAERVALPSKAPASGVYGIQSADAAYSVPAPVISIAPAAPENAVQPYVSQPTAYTSVSGMERSDGSIGTVRIPSLGIEMKVWEGETNDSMAKGLGHYSTTTAWDGNVCVCGHNRGARFVIGSIKDLSVGDTITYTTVYGTRTYSVSFVGTIAYTDWSHLQATSDNRITLTTCLADHPSNRVCVQAVEVV